MLFSSKRLHTVLGEGVNKTARPVDGHPVQGRFDRTEETGLE